MATVETVSLLLNLGLSFAGLPGIDAQARRIVAYGGEYRNALLSDPPCRAVAGYRDSLAG